mmetsp:Transcript_64256/g.199343  ORF Transcript_64256/g.199343 Transcript_64256/m.199343 type:complete len:285 (+) Transcript_64256:1490-2344(+)
MAASSSALGKLSWPASVQDLHSDLLSPPRSCAWTSGSVSAVRTLGYSGSVSVEGAVPELATSNSASAVQTPGCSGNESLVATVPTLMNSGSASAVQALEYSGSVSMVGNVPAMKTSGSASAVWTLGHSDRMPVVGTVTAPRAPKDSGSVSHARTVPAQGSGSMSVAGTVQAAASSGSDSVVRGSCQQRTDGGFWASSGTIGCTFQLLTRPVRRRGGKAWASADATRSPLWVLLTLLSLLLNHCWPSEMSDEDHMHLTADVDTLERIFQSAGLPAMAPAGPAQAR